MQHLFQLRDALQEFLSVAMIAFRQPIVPFSSSVGDVYALVCVRALQRVMHARQQQSVTLAA